MKYFQILLLFIFSIDGISQNQTNPFIERPINGLIYGSSSILVDDFNQDGKQDILAFPIKNKGLGIYSNQDSLNFSLDRLWLNFDIKALSYANIYPDSTLDFVVLTDSNINLIEQLEDTLEIRHSFNISNAIVDLNKTHEDYQFIGLDTLGQLSVLNIDTINITLDNVSGQQLITDYQIDNSTNDTTHIFTYSDSLNRLTYLILYDDTVVTQTSIDSLNINATFSIFFDTNYHVVCSSAEEDSIFHYTFTSDSIVKQTITSNFSNSPILDASLELDSLKYHYLWREQDILIHNYYDLSGYKINQITVLQDSIYSDEKVLNYINQCQFMHPVNLDSDSVKEYVLFSDVLDQITIYKDQQTQFNISRSNVSGKIQTIMIDADLDGDLDAASMMQIQDNPVGGDCDIVYFENIGNYQFINTVVSRSSMNNGLLRPLTLNIQNRPHVFFQLNNVTGSHINVIRFWLNDLNEKQTELLDSSANSASLYSFDRMFVGDLEGDGDKDIILQSGKRVYAYQNQDSTFVRLVNTYGAGFTNYQLNQFKLIDHDNNGSENAFIGLAGTKLGYFVSERDTNLPQTNTQIHVDDFVPINTTIDPNSYVYGKLIDWNFDGKYDLTTGQNQFYDKKATVILNNGDYTFNPNTVKQYTFVNNGDTVSPFHNMWRYNYPHVHDFENTFKPSIVNYEKYSYEYYSLINDTTFSALPCFPFHEENFAYYYWINIDDYDNDNDKDFIGLNDFNGSSFYENITCNSKSTVDITVCQPYVSPSGLMTISESGTYYDVIQNHNGCDSTIQINILALFDDTSFTVTECSNYLSPSGFSWTETGIYQDTLINQFGCDSTFNINLTILDEYTIQHEAHCDSMVSPSQQYTWYNSGLYFDTLTNSNGCKTFHEINLEIESSQAEFQLLDSIFVLDDKGDDITQILWYDCLNDSIVEKDNSVFKPENVGLYSVIIETSMCKDTLPCLEFKPLIDTANTFSILPNGSNNLIIEFDGLAEDVTINIFNIRGQLMGTVKNNNILNEIIPMDTYAYGIYIFTIQFNTQKVIKKVPWINYN